MTPYVVNEDETTADKKPKSIMVNGKSNNNNNNATVNGDLMHHQQNMAEETASSTASSPDESVKPLLPNSRNRIRANGKAGKAAGLKRVSFGSSKGSMVETLVYDHQDEIPEISYKAPLITNGKVVNNGHCARITFKKAAPQPLSTTINFGEEAPLKIPSKVRVTFYESQKPIYVTTPESPDIPFDFLNLSSNMSTPNNDKHPEYNRQQSTESGIDNPFRPDGELSREADTIVSLIKEGKPITPVKTEPDGGYFGEDGQAYQPNDCTDARISPKKARYVENAKVGANGSAPKDKSPSEPGLVEVQHGIVVPASDASQVEQVMIKKKPKCKCCVVQ